MLFKLCWKVVSRDESGACETSCKAAEGTKIFFLKISQEMDAAGLKKNWPAV